MGTTGPRHERRVCRLLSLPCRIKQARIQNKHVWSAVAGRRPHTYVGQKSILPPYMLGAVWQAAADVQPEAPPTAVEDSLHPRISSAA
eukprot:1161589-Pelagomonas_calceolata.AAC.5